MADTEPNQANRPTTPARASSRWARAPKSSLFPTYLGRLPSPILPRTVGGGYERHFFARGSPRSNSPARRILLARERNPLITHGPPRPSHPPLAYLVADAHSINVPSERSLPNLSRPDPLTSRLTGNYNWQERWKGAV